MKNDADSSPMVTWQAESLRFTAMYSDAAPPKQELWAEIVGKEPSQQMSTGRPKTIQESGDWENGQLFAAGTDYRFDWVYTIRIPSKDSIPNVGAYSDALEKFKEIVGKWLPSSRPIHRVAFAPLLLQQVPSHAEGYKLLGHFLPSVKVDPASADFLYRVNRPVEYSFGAAKLTVNRLSTWQVMYYSQFEMTPSPSQTALVTSEPDYALKAELDMNTSPKFAGTMPTVDAMNVFSKLVEYANEIAEKGDIA